MSSFCVLMYPKGSHSVSEGKWLWGHILPWKVITPRKWPKEERHHEGRPGA